MHGRLDAAAAGMSLPPETASPGVARRFVREAVTAAGASDAVVETCVLLTSELVTNVVLHARTPLQLTVGATDEGILVQVSDESPALPHLALVLGAGTSGRGLLLLDRLALAWGTQTRAEAQGKTVWFTVSRTVEPQTWAPELPDLDLLLERGLEPEPAAFAGQQEAGARRSEEPEAGAAALEGTAVLVRLRNVPCAPALAVLVHLEAEIRELTLLSLAGTAPPGCLESFTALMEVLEPLRQRHAEELDRLQRALTRGLERGEQGLDLDLVLREPGPDAGRLEDELRRLGRRVTATERECAAHQTLLTLAPSALALRVRGWIAAQVVHQVAGHAPEAWAG